MKRSEQAGFYGLLAEFKSAHELLNAATNVHAKGYRLIDAFSPFPIEGLSERLGKRVTRLPLAVLVAGIIGFIAGYGLQYWTSVIDYPINIGGRPLNSIPAFIPVAFETTVLLASLTAAVGMLIRNGFPSPYHPVFNVEKFKSVTTDGFFLIVEASDPQFAMTETKRYLKSIGAAEVHEVLR